MADSMERVVLCEDDALEESWENIENNEDYIIEDKDQCCTIFGNCSRGDVIQFVLYVLLFLGNLGAAVLLSVSRLTGHSQYLPSASLDPDTTTSAPHLTEMTCDMGFIYSVISFNVVFAFIMIKWVAQLNESLRWLRTEAFLNALCALVLIATICLRVSGMIVWCGQVVSKSACEDHPHPCPDGWRNVTSCYSGVLFVKEHFGYNLEAPFIYSAASLACSGFSLVVWLAVLVCVLSKFCMIWQKERLFQDNAFRGYDFGHQCDGNCYHHSTPGVQAEYHGDLRRMAQNGPESVQGGPVAETSRGHMNTTLNAVGM